jgi:hypothetical protein
MQAGVLDGNASTTILLEGASRSSGGSVGAHAPVASWLLTSLLRVTEAEGEPGKTGELPGKGVAPSPRVEVRPLAHGTSCLDRGRWE